MVIADSFEKYLLMQGWQKDPQGHDPTSFFCNFERDGMAFEAMIIMTDSPDSPPEFRAEVHPVYNHPQKVTSEFAARDIAELCKGLKEFQRRFEAQHHWRLHPEKADYFSSDRRGKGGEMFGKGVLQAPIIPHAEENWQPLVKKLGLIIVRRPGRLQQESLALLEELRLLSLCFATHFLPPCVLPEDFLPKTSNSVRRSLNLGAKLVAFETTPRSKLPKERFDHSAREIFDQIIPQVYGSHASNAITCPSAAEFLWLGKTFYPQLDEPDSTEWFRDKEAQYLQLYGGLSCIRRADHYSHSPDRAYRLLVELQYEFLD